MAEDTLATELAAACEVFSKNLKGDDGGREGAIHALGALVRYAMRVRPDVTEQLAPLVVLDTSLRNLAIGKVSPMLKHSKRKGRPPASLEQEGLQQLGAVAVEILMDGGWKERAAEKFVQKKFKKYGVDFSSTTIGNWRSKVRENLAYRSGPLDKVDMYRERWQAWSAIKGQYSIATQKPLMCAKEWVEKFIFDKKDLVVFLN